MPPNWDNVRKKLALYVFRIFFNFFQNFAPWFPEKDIEAARNRCRIHGIRSDFFDIPMNFPGIPVSTGLRKEPDALLSMRMKR